MRCRSRTRAARRAMRAFITRLAFGVERRQRRECGDRLGREDVGIAGLEVASELERSRWHSYR